MVVIAKLPFENSFDELGCINAPEEIIKNLPEFYTSESGKEIIKKNLEIIDIHQDSYELIHKRILNLISKENKSLFLGGDHSISYHIGKAFFDVCNNEGKEVCLIVFDAHADCKKCEVNQDNCPNNLQWLRSLIENGFPAEKVILIGLRSMSSEENKFLEENKILTYLMKNILDLNEICDIVMEIANKNEIYISIDIDVVDSVFVPGTARAETTGFTSRQLLYFLQRLNLIKTLRVIDICEINPKKDINNVTSKFGAKILGELI
ncbi:MAG TPA: arginase family protein [Candidatus Paceibacterota bacterium]|nr:arginase family protein [Candidatus Paceibacterota bacterium]